MLAAAFAGYTEEEQAIMRGFMVQAEFDKAIGGIKNMPLEKLKEQTALSLAHYRKQNLVTS